jgi:phage host-nuclease inhibitor protein Gam
MGSALSKAGRLRKEKMDIARAEEKTQFIQEQLAALEASLNEEIEKLTESMEKYREATQEHLVRPQSTNINIKVFGLAWVPVEIEN